MMVRSRQGSRKSFSSSFRCRTTSVPRRSACRLGLQRVAAAAVGLPAHAMLGTESRAPGDQRHLVGDDEGGVETDAELADELSVHGLVAGQTLQEAARARAGDAADGLHDLLPAHADAVVRDGQGPCLLVHLDADAQVRVVLQ